MPLLGVANDRPQGPHGSVFIDLSHQDPSQAELSYIFPLTPTYPPVLSLPHPTPNLAKLQISKSQTSPH